MLRRAHPLLGGSLLVLALLGAACAGNTASAPEVGGAEAGRPDPNVLTEDDLRGFTNANQAVMTLRNGWLRRRAAGGFNDIGQQVWIYQDGVRLGGPETLTQISVASIQTMRYYNGLQASQRWGLGHENGVIFITSKNQ